MHLVYLLVFGDRKKLDIQPYYYIGSKSNAIYDGTKIIKSDGNPYYGSSLWENYNIICEKEKNIKIYILSEFDDYAECLNYEKQMHIKHDVVADTRYFNKSIATISSYSDPNYGTFRNLKTNKVVRLQKNHPKVLNGEYVNVNKGYKTYNNGIQEKQFLNGPPEGWILGRLEKNIKMGNSNPFYGKKHNSDTLSKIVSTRRETYKNNPERYLEILNIQAENARKTFAGVPKTPESNIKRSRKNMIMLKNKNTGESVRIHRNEKYNYDDSIWQNPFKLAHEGKPNGSRWCTDGVKNLKISIEEELPEGFKYGRTYHNWNEKKRKPHEN